MFKNELVLIPVVTRIVQNGQEIFLEDNQRMILSEGGLEFLTQDNQRKGSVAIFSRYPQEPWLFIRRLGKNSSPWVSPQKTIEAQYLGTQRRLDNSKSLD